jgi:two-component system NarL family sensor kinase
MPSPKPQVSDTEQLRRRNRELSILKTISEELNRSVELNQTLDTTLAQVADLLDLQTGWIWLLQEETGEPYLAAAQNLPPGLVRNPELMEGSCYCLLTYQAGDLDGAANVNVITCSRLQKLVDGTDGLRYHASVPLYVHGRQLGVLNVASTDWRELTADDLRLLYTVGDLLSIAIERARLFERSTVLAALQERNRLAREIHDTLAQSLAGIALQLETADALLEAGKEPDRVQAAVHQALRLSRLGLEDARRSVLDLRAAPLEGSTLKEALQSLADAARAGGSLKVSVEFSGNLASLPLRVETGLYRIAQEALSNIVQHSSAEHAWLRLSAASGIVTLIVQDDGQGFDPGRVGEGRFGLVGMRERVKMLGGRMELTSNPGVGTQLETTVPVE